VEYPILFIYMMVDEYILEDWREERRKRRKEKRK
jgi:hypothetical protein